MRVLTVRQPWAWAIIHGGKDVENRVRNIAGAYRGPVAIHAGKAFDNSAWDAGPMGDLLSQVLAEGREAEFTPGAIIGLVDLTDVHDVDDCVSTYGDLCSTWAQGDSLSDLHLVLANPRSLKDPIPFKGALGLRTLDDDTTAHVLAALSPSTGTQKGATG